MNLNEKIKKLDVLDIGLIKATSLVIGIIIGSYIVAFTQQYLWPLVVLAVLLVLRPAYRAYIKK